jgi:hypothetical protein
MLTKSSPIIIGNYANKKTGGEAYFEIADEHKTDKN